MKKIYAITVMVFGSAILSNAQTVITNQSMTQDGKNVTVSFDVDTDKSDIPTRRKEVILPYIYNGKDTLYFDALEIYGKGRFKRERQENALAGDKTWELTGNQTLKKEGIYNYTSEVPLKRWMKSANLGIKRQMVGCACEKDMSDENLAENVELFQEPQLQRRTPEYAVAEVERKEVIEQDNLEIVFRVSKTDMDMTLFNNEEVFNKIITTLDKIHENENLKIKKLHIVGFASPEGPESFNEWLGINRANSLITAILEKRPEYNLSFADFEIHNGEENWDGLRRVLVQSDIKEKDEVIAIIDDQNLSSEAKKSKIKQIEFGKVWLMLVNEVYPYLRSVKYHAEYYDTSADVLTEKVKQANALIQEGKYQEAYLTLEPFRDDVRAANTIGVSLMMQGQYEEAMPWFQKAKEAGVEVAQSNIDSINAEIAYEAQQRQIIEDYLKKFE